MDIILGLIAGLIVGGAIGMALVFSARSKAAVAQAGLQAEKARLEGELTQITALREQVVARERELSELRQAASYLQSSKAELQERAEAAERSKLEMIAEKEASFEAQKKLLADAEAILGKTFSDLSLKSLDLAQKNFIEMANAKFEGTSKEAQKEREKQQQAFESLVKPIGESLEKLDKQSAVMDEGIKVLSKETDQLANALRKPVSRGDWGEMVLVTTLQNAGMVEGQHFEVEHTTDLSEEGRRRADVVIHLPNKRDIIIDAKTPLESYTAGANSPDETVRRERFANHARLVKEHIRHLSSKKYWERYSGSADFVILFLPTEGSYQAAIEADPTLINEGQSAKVYLANPISVMSLIHLAHHTWRQKEFVENAEQVRLTAGELYKRLSTFVGHVQRVGDSLQRSVSSYNQAVGSLELNVLPQARRVHELKAVEAAVIEPLAPVQTEIRALTSPEARQLALDQFDGEA